MEVCGIIIFIFLGNFIQSHGMLNFFLNMIETQECGDKDAIYKRISTRCGKVSRGKGKKKAREGRIINNGVTSFLVKSKVLLQILIKKDNQLGISKPADSILSRSCGKIRSLKNFIKSFDSLQKGQTKVYSSVQIVFTFNFLATNTLFRRLHTQLLCIVMTLRINSTRLTEVGIKKGSQFFQRLIFFSQKQ